MSMKLSSAKQVLGYRVKGSVELWLLVASLVIGFALRFYKLGEIPVSLYWDETAIGYDAYTLNVWGKDMHGNSGFQAIFPSYGDYKLPLMIWITSLSERFFGPTPFAVRLPSALAGMGIILISYVLSLELTHNKRIAGLTALFTSILPIDTLFSRTGFEGHLAVLCIGLTIWLWLRSTRHVWLLGISSLTSALAVYSYFSARIVVPLIATFTFIYLWRQTSSRWKISALLSFAVWFGLLLPIYQSPFYAASNQFRLSTSSLLDTGPFAVESNILREQSGNSFISRLVYHRYILQGKAILANVFTHLDFGYLFISGDSNLRHSTGNVGILFITMFPLVALGFFILCRRNLSFLLWWISLWFAFVLPAAIPTEVPHALRSLNTVLFWPLVAAWGLYYLWEYTSSHFVRLLFMFVPIFLLIELGVFAHDYMAHYPTRSATDWQSGYFEAASYLQQHESEFDSCAVQFPDDRLYLYFLFGQRMAPNDLAALNKQSYLFTVVGKYRFERVASLPQSPRSCVVLDNAAWDAFHQPLPTQIIHSAEGNPLMYILIGKRS